MPNLCADAVLTTSTECYERIVNDELPSNCSRRSKSMSYSLILFEIPELYRGVGAPRNEAIGVSETAEVWMMGTYNLPSISIDNAFTPAWCAHILPSSGSLTGGSRLPRELVAGATSFSPPLKRSLGAG